MAQQGGSLGIYKDRYRDLSYPGGLHFLFGSDTQLAAKAIH